MRRRRRRSRRSLRRMVRGRRAARRAVQAAVDGQVLLYALRRGAIDLDDLPPHGKR